MTELTQVLLLTTLAGATIPVGALLATVERIHPAWLEREFRHSVISFGGGVLLSAVALVLVPEGIERLSMPWVITAFLAGGFCFLLLDIALARSHSSVSQLAAMLSDFIPEAIALGAAFATDQSAGESTGLLLAGLIALQNLPEGFNAYRELSSKKTLSRAAILFSFVLLVPLGPVAGAIGYVWLSDFPEVVGFLMLFAASGILYLTFQDIAPQAVVRHRFAPAFGAVVGFLMGVLGQMLVE